MWLVSIRVMLVAGALAPTSSRQQPPHRPSLEQKLATEIPAAAVLGGGWLALDLAAPTLTRPSCPCAANQVNGLDRFATSLHWPPGATLGNFVLGATLVGSLAGSVLIANDAYGRWRNALMVIESVALTGLIGQGVKIGASRPYPFMYREGVSPLQNPNGENYESFWSGHAAVSMAAVSTLIMESTFSHLGRVWTYVLAVVGPLIALGAGIFEMSSGFHFPTDILAGGAAGAGIGITNVLIHQLGAF